MHRRLNDNERTLKTKTSRKGNVVIIQIEIERVLLTDKNDLYSETMIQVWRRACVEILEFNTPTRLQTPFSSLSTLRFRRIPIVFLVLSSLLEAKFFVNMSVS